MARLASSIFLVGLCAISSSALAHGREAATTGIVFRDSDSSRVVIRTTFGLLFSDDGGASFRYRCAEAVGFDAASEDPALAWLSNGSLLVGSFSGLSRNQNSELCDFAAVPTFSRRYAIDVQASAMLPTRVFALDAPGDEANALMRSDDSGETWQRLFGAELGVLFERLRVAPSDESVMYISGAIPAGRAGPERRVQFFRSTDGGVSFAMHDLVLETDERNAHVLAVHPQRPNTVFVRMVRRAEDSMGERLMVSEDGGDTWRLLLRARQITSLAIFGETVWAGSASEGLFRGDSSGTLARVASNIATVRCLSVRARPNASPELWICSRDSEAFAVGKSQDGGDNFEPVWRYYQATSTIRCACSSMVGARCAPTLFDYFTDLGRPNEMFSAECDAGLRRDAGVASPRPASGCSIRSRMRLEAGFLPLLLSAIAVHFARVAGLRERRRRFRR